MHLHAERVRGDPAVHLQGPELVPEVFLHGQYHIAGLKTDGFESGAGQMGFCAGPCQSHDGAPGVGAPVRGEQAGERGYEIDAAGVFDARRQSLDLLGAPDDPELVTEPLHGRARHGDRAFQRVNGRAAFELVAQGAEEAVPGPDDVGPGVDQQEVARPVGALGFSRAQADLADHGRVLVAQDGSQGNAALTRAFEADVTEGPSRRADLGEGSAGYGEHGQQLVVPRQSAQVHEHRPAGVGHVRDVTPALRATGQVPHQPAVDGAAAGSPGGDGFPGGVDILDDPLDLGCRKIGCRR